MFKVVKKAHYNGFKDETTYQYELHEYVSSFLGLRKKWIPKYGQYTELQSVNELREFVRKERKEEAAKNFLEDVKVYATVEDFLSDA